MEPPELALVEWLDACQHQESELGDELGTLIYSVGFVVLDNEQGVRLCPSWAPEADWHDYLEIPRPYVRRVTPLTG